MDLKRWACFFALTCGVGFWTFPAQADTTGNPLDTDSDTESSGDDCGGTCDVEESISITSPSAGAEISGPFSVTLEASDGCSCDTCGCYAVSPEQLVLEVDGVAEASCADCPSPHTFEVDLVPGEHELRARAEYDFHTQSSEIVTVTVAGSNTTTGGEATTGGATTTGEATSGATTAGAPDPTTDASPAGSTSGETAAPEDADADGGGGCSVGGRDDGLPALGALGLLILGVRRRRGKA